MTHWSRFYRRLAGEPVTVEHTVPPADVAGPALVLDDTAEALDIEHHARLREALRIIHRTLLTESLKDEALRNPDLIDRMLDLRSVLLPSAPGSEVLVEVPPVRQRYGVPVIPGRAS